MTFHVRTQPRAHRDVDDILRWIAHKQQSQRGASRWLAAYEAAVSALPASPESYSIAPEDEFINREIRQFLRRVADASIADCS